ncbi:MAG: hypothetical protein IPK25_15900 [Saprospiraceae bacterium]|nr:hypothetical protein [Saprospiraceae bacterium]
MIDEACIEVRRIAHDMVPYSIKLNGLTGALEDLKRALKQEVCLVVSIYLMLKMYN